MAYHSTCGFENSTSDFLIGALTILIVAWIIQTIRKLMRKRNRLLNLGAKLPGPKTLPLIGNALQFACKPEQLLDRAVQAIEPYKDQTPMRFWLGPLLHVVITEPRDIEVILNSQKSTCKGSTYRFLFPFIGDGLISGSGDVWRSHRKFIAPMLNFRTLERYMDTFQKHSEILVKRLKPLINETEFDVMPYVARCNNDSVCETIMGCRNINSQDNHVQEFMNSSEKMYEIIHNRIMKVWLHPDCIFRLSSSYQEQKKCQQVLNHFTEKLIAEAKQREFAATSNGETGSDGDRNSLLDQLIQQIQRGQGTLNDSELSDEIYTLYLASQDTITVVTSFALVMLAIHQDIQEKARNEITRVLKTDGSITSSLSDFKYLELVIKETLRLFPIAPFLARKLRGDLTLDTCVLPEGCEVVIATHVTHRNSRHWKNPEKFIPERFLPEEIADRHAYAYIPFSGGLMGCIGQKFAMMSLKTILANVIKNYRINSTMRLEDIKLKSDISIRSINGYKLSLKLS